MTNIRELAYELYKEDWKTKHLTENNRLESLCDYYAATKECQALLPNEDPLSYEDYIEEFGYNGELYACFDEFMETEYLDHEYIMDLFQGANMADVAAEYAKDVIRIKRELTLYIELE